MRKIIILSVFLLIAIVCSRSTFALSDDIARSMMADVDEFIQAGNLANEQAAPDIAELSLRAEIKPDELYRQLQKFGMGLFYSGKQAMAVKYYRLLLSHINRETNATQEDAAFMLNSYVCLGASLEELGMQNIAMEYYVEGIEKAGDADFEQYKAMLLNNIGVIYLNIGVMDKALKYFTDAMALNEALGNNRELFLNYNNAAAVYAAEDNYAQALDYTLKSLQYVDREADAADYYTTHINLGILNMKEHRYPMALSYLRNAVNNLQRLGFSQALVEAQIALSDVYSKTQMPDSAKFYNDAALKLARDLGNACREYKALEQSSRIAAQLNQWEQSWQLLQRAYSIRDSLHDVDNRQRIEQWESIYNLRLHDDDKGSFISKCDPESIFYAMLCIIAFLLSAVAVLLMMKVRRDKMLKINAQARMENEKRNDEIQSTIDRRNRELTTYTLEKLKTNEFINDISEDLRRLLGEVNPREREQKTRIQLILKKLMQFGDQDSWKEFQYYFEKVHPQFYEILDAKFPELTSKEKRLCAFLYLDLSTKEIASITFREVRSVESSRNRLRKKLNIPQDANLLDYLKSIIKE